MFVRRSGNAVIVSTPAKINLFLEVLARRGDGYHELETLMSAVAIFDTLKFTSDSSGELSLHCRWAYGWSARTRVGLGDLPPARDNIVFRAITKLRERAGVSLGAHIEIVKRIPSAAGLGGASTDAAAALVAANEAWNLNWPRERLAELAAELGSDVPFFLATGSLGPGAAVCRGRGERVEPAPGLARANYVIVKPPEGLSTPLVFKHCRPAQQPANSANLLAAARRGNPVEVAQGLVNRLEAPAAELSPGVKKLQRVFQRVGGPGSQMSGSGTSYFGIYRSARQARRAASLLRAARVGAVYQVSTAAAPRRRAM